MAKSKWINKSSFDNLKVGEKVVILYMLGDAYISSKQYEETLKFNDTCVDVKFESGPWKDKTFPFTRRQISRTNESFPMIVIPPGKYKKK